MTDRSADPAPPERLAEELSRAWPFALLERDGRVVGLWYVRAREGRTVHVDVAFRSHDGAPCGLTREIRPELSPAFEVAEAVESTDEGRHLSRGVRTFARVLLTMRDVSLGEAGHHHCLGMERHLEGTFPDADGGDVIRAAKAHLDALSDAVEAFAATLDGRALAMLVRGDALAGPNGYEDCYDGIDATFEPGAPLRAAVEAFPGAAPSLRGLWCREPGLFRRDSLALTPEELVRHVAVHDWNVAPWVLRHAADVQRTLLLDPPDRSGWDDVEFWDDVETDHLLLPMRMLGDLPPSWVPVDLEGWAAFLRCGPSILNAQDNFGQGVPLAPLLDVGGRWTEWEVRIRAVVPAETLTADAVADCTDVSAAYAAQVLGPACAHGSAWGGGDVTWTDASRVLHSGRNLRNVLASSRAWHEGRWSIDAVIASLSPQSAVPGAWGAGLPDHRSGDLWLRVLRTDADLAAEGRDGADLHGVGGLAHCVGGYGARCRSGELRIASVRRTGADGSWTRVSTASLSVRGRDASVAEHRAARNAPPPADAVAFVRAYVDAMRAGRLAVDAAGLAPVAEPGHGAGYDVGRPGAWEAVRDAWDPFVPRRLRGRSKEHLARLTTVASEGTRHLGWLERAPTLHED